MAAPDPLIGTHISSYRVVARVGVGGMGAVYLAEHPLIGKRVAIKVLHAEFAERKDVVQRFFQEARAVSSLKHPNIVDVIDFGVLKAATGELHYCVMELLEGETLRDKMKGGPLPEAVAATLAGQIADAVAAAHGKAIIHRDLKPENVFLIGAHRDVVKILDFGIAKLIGDTASMQTQAGILLGTPSYMSPEQCMARPVDSRTDVYALGVMLFEMCTGRVPFIGQSYADLLIKQIEGELPPPRSINPALSESIERVIIRAMEKDPNARFQTMEEFQAALATPGGLQSPTKAMPSATPIQDTTVIMGGGASTTLQAAASEAHARAAAGRRSSTGLVLGVVIGLLAAGGAGAFLLLREDPTPSLTPGAPVPSPEGDPKPPAERPEAPAGELAKVVLHVASEPSQATVKRDDGTLLGTTPLDTEVVPGTRLLLTIHKDGFKDEVRAVVVGDRDKTISIQLAAEAGKPAPHHDRKPSQKPDRPRKPLRLGDDILAPSL
ncbi:MAG: serine/threonine protein kinase [Myxococcales bacterium]|nr:serine/threonine protein kinase [Myxococcales bacterium]